MNKKLVVASLGVVFAAGFAMLGSFERAEAKDKKKDVVAERLAKFDELDYEAFSKQNWDLFHNTHTDDVVVVWPDGYGKSRGLSS